MESEWIVSRLSRYENVLIVDSNQDTPHWFNS